jgi:hypothetical protein
MSERCVLCASGRDKVFSTTLLQKHEVDYFYCENCGLLQTEEPYWLQEAYSSAIADADTGLVLRNLAIARRLSAVLYFCFDREGVFVDAAGGYGLLTRLLRDTGFDFYWQDKYCQNQFARGFEAEGIDRSVAAVTAFEVLEHVQDPLEFIDSVLSEFGSRTFVFTTELFAGDPPAPGRWWYYTPQTGQHISFFQERTLRYLGERLSLRLYSNRGMHVLTDRPLNESTFRFLTGKGSWLGQAWARLRMTSKTFADHEYIVGGKRGRGSN